MAERISRLLVLLIAIMLAVAPSASAVVSTSGTVRLHDYLTPLNDLNCSNDVTAKVNAAVSDWLAMQKAHNGATLDLGSGCYRTSAPIILGDPAGAGHFIFGEIRGDGPDLTSFSSSALRGMVINEAKNMRIGGFSIGGPTPQSGPDPGLDGGLVIGKAGQDLGSNGNTFHDIHVQNFLTCVMVGDSRTAGSAANNTFDNISASNCSIGYHLVTWNTLSTIFDNSGCNTVAYCVWSDTAYGFTWRNGNGTNNGQVFHLSTCCQFSVYNWREESASRVGSKFASIGGPQSMTMFDLADSLIMTNAAEAISTRGPVQLSIRNTALSGTIGAYGSSVDVTNSKTTAASILTGGQTPVNFRNFATYRADANGAFISWLTN